MTIQWKKKENYDDFKDVWIKQISVLATKKWFLINQYFVFNNLHNNDVVTTIFINKSDF